MGPPDCMTPARNKPSLFPSFVIIWRATEIAPALSPQLCVKASASPTDITKKEVAHMVTLEGSPPKLEMYLFTQRSASRSRQVFGFWSIVRRDKLKLTVLKPEVADALFLDLFSRKEPKG